MKGHSKREGFGRPRGFDRDAALRIALDTFWKHGYEQTTIAILASAMGIASASIYCAYGSKAQLFLEALRYYQKTYWDPLYEEYRLASDIYLATARFFREAANILLAPNAPCGCLIVMGFLNLPEAEPELHMAIAERRDHTRRMFRDKLKEAVNKGQIPAACDIPGIAGALHNFFEGLSIQARGTCVFRSFWQLRKRVCSFCRRKQIFKTNFYAGFCKCRIWFNCAGLIQERKRGRVISTDFSSWNIRKRRDWPGHAGRRLR